MNERNASYRYLFNHQNERLKDTTGAIIRRQLKDRNYNGLKNNDKRTNNDTQRTTHKIYNWSKRSPQQHRGWTWVIRKRRQFLSFLWAQQSILLEAHKHLVLTISEDGNWNEHVNNIMIKVASRLSVFRRVKCKLKRPHLQTIYISFIRPLMEYGDIVWDNIPDYLKESLESLQLEATRIITDATKLMSRQLLYDETGWETLQTRRSNHKLINFHEMFHKDAPDYLNYLSETHQHNTRRSNNTVYLNSRNLWTVMRAGDLAP
jgi:hypothetical protein